MDVKIRLESKRMETVRVLAKKMAKRITGFRKERETVEWSGVEWSGVEWSQWGQINTSYKHKISRQN